MNKKRLLIVEDHAQVRRLTKSVFVRDFEVFEADSEEKALRLHVQEHPDVIFLDVNLYGEQTGWNILRVIREKDSWVIIYIISGEIIDKNNPLLKLADGFFEKPFDILRLRALLQERGVLT